MKVKKDFITNSSSVSYTLWGLILDEKEIMSNEKFMKRLYESSESDEMFKQDFPNFESFRNNIHPSDIMECLYSLACDIKFECASEPYSREIIFGKSITSMFLNQTYGEFINEVEKKLKEIGIDKKPVLIKRSWRT